jgi:hypothetical protein
MLSKVIAIIINKKLPHIPSLHSCVFHYIDIQDDFLLVCFNFNFELEPDFKIFGEIFIFSQSISCQTQITVVYYMYS